MNHARIISGLFSLALFAGCSDTSSMRIVANPTLRQPMVHESGGYTFDPYTGEYVGAEPAYATERRAQIKQEMHEQIQDWMRRHYVAGNTVMTDRGDMIITENGVQRVIVNPYRDRTHVEPRPVTGGKKDPDESDDESDDRYNNDL